MPAFNPLLLLLLLCLLLPCLESRSVARTLERQLHSLVDSWRLLLPQFITCYASIQGEASVPPVRHRPPGCDFCHYFFSAYNTSVPASVCTGGCAMGVLPACAGVLAASLQTAGEQIFQGL